MLDASHIGKLIEPHSAAVEAGRLRLFAKAIGETRPEYLNEAAARAAGLPGIPAPPTFVVSLDLEMAEPFKWLTDMGVDIVHVLHGGERLRYLAPVYAGDTLTFRSRVADILTKKSSSKAFVVKETEVVKQEGTKVAELRATLVVREGR